MVDKFLEVTGNAMVPVDDIRTIIKGEIGADKNVLCVTGMLPKNISKVLNTGYNLYQVNPFWAKLFSSLTDKIETYYTKFHCRAFVSGGAQGIDMLFYKAVYHLSNKYNDVYNVLMYPSENYNSQWVTPTGNLLADWNGRENLSIFAKSDVESMKDSANGVVNTGLVTMQGASDDVMLKRNDIMIACSDYALGVYFTPNWSDRKACMSGNILIDPGTWYTLNVAKGAYNTREICKNRYVRGIETMDLYGNSVSKIAVQKSVSTSTTVSSAKSDNNKALMPGRILFASTLYVYDYQKKLTAKQQQEKEDTRNAISTLTEGTKTRYVLIMRKTGSVPTNTRPDIKKLEYPQLSPEYNTLKYYQIQSNRNMEWWSGYVLGDKGFTDFIFNGFLKDIIGGNEMNANVTLRIMINMLTDAVTGNSVIMMCRCDEGNNGLLRCHRTIVRYLMQWIAGTTLNEQFAIESGNKEQINFINEVKGYVGDLKTFRSDLFKYIFAHGESNLVAPDMPKVSGLEAGTTLFDKFKELYKDATGYALLDFKYSTRSKDVIEAYARYKEAICNIAKNAPKPPKTHNTTDNNSNSEETTPASTEVGDSNFCVNTSTFTMKAHDTSEFTPLPMEAEDKEHTYYISGNRPKVMFGDRKESYTFSFYKEMIPLMLTDVKDMYAKGYRNVLIGGAQGIDQVYGWVAVYFRNAIYNHNLKVPADKKLAKFNVKMYAPSPDFHTAWDDGTEGKDIFTQDTFIELRDSCNFVGYAGDYYYKEAPFDRDDAMRLDSNALVCFRKVENALDKPSGTALNLKKSQKDNLMIRSYALVNHSFEINKNETSMEFSNIPNEIDTLISADELVSSLSTKFDS